MELHSWTKSTHKGTLFVVLLHYTTLFCLYSKTYWQLFLQHVLVTASLSLPVRKPWQHTSNKNTCKRTADESLSVYTWAMRVLLPLCWSKSLINSSLFASGCCLATSIADCTQGKFLVISLMEVLVTWLSCDMANLSVGASQVWLSSKFQQYFCHIFPIEEINKSHSI